MQSQLGEFGDHRSSQIMMLCDGVDVSRPIFVFSFKLIVCVSMSMQILLQLLDATLTELQIDLQLSPNPKIKSCKNTGKIQIRISKFATRPVTTSWVANRFATHRCTPAVIEHVFAKTVLLHLLFMQFACILLLFWWYFSAFRLGNKYSIHMSV